MLRIVFRSVLDPHARDRRSGITWREFTQKRGWTADDHARADQMAREGGAWTKDREALPSAPFSRRDRS